MSVTTIESTGLAQGTWNLDASHSTVGFTVRHAGISKVRGQFTELEGALTLGETLAESSVTATIAGRQLQLRRRRPRRPRQERRLLRRRDVPHPDASPPPPSPAMLKTLN